ncbi:hypothetical protein FQN57_005670 [Myotisia sp. PD_48]|nr:hypothetical protein FQN57_005670 [Myotisia sp. PD_48]
MATDALLNTYVSAVECLYRIQRGKSIRYVTLSNPELIPEPSRTHGPALIRELSKLEQWPSDWETLRIQKSPSGVIIVQLNPFPAHTLPPELIEPDIHQFNILDLPFCRRMKSHAFLTELDGRSCYVKYARFGFELRYVMREIQAYRFLRESNFTMIPKFLGYVYEEPGRIIGFLLEDVGGRHATFSDLAICQAALGKLHEHIIHGDPNKYNILITDEGPKFIDLEESYKRLEDEREWKIKTAREMHSMHALFLNCTGLGSPYEQDGEGYF